MMQTGKAGATAMAIQANDADQADQAGVSFSEAKDSDIGMVNEAGEEEAAANKTDLYEPLEALGGRSELAPMLDAHIHLEQYSDVAITAMAAASKRQGVEGLIAVSMHLESCRRTEAWAEKYPALVKPAYGFHPEQPIPAEPELEQLLDWIRQRAGRLTAVGEIGLPYYMRSEKEQAGEPFELQPYIEVLERFLVLAAELDKPVVLHAVYEDAEVVCDLLERHGIRKAHFHWFKGAEATIRRMAERGYFISFTPDIAYEEEIRELARVYPPELIMAETDGPWPFEGPFEGKATHPAMVHSVALALAELRGWTYEEAALTLAGNTRRFYRTED